MSEILFKAKRKDNGEWIEGYPYPSITGELRYMTGYDPLNMASKFLKEIS